jgi:hypothetical protein
MDPITIFVTGFVSGFIAAGLIVALGWLAVPSPATIFRAAIPSDDDAKRIRKQLEEHYAGPGSAAIRIPFVSETSVSGVFEMPGEWSPPAAKE